MVAHAMCGFAGEMYEFGRIFADNELKG